MTSSSDAPRRRTTPTPSLPTALLTRPDTLGSLARLYTTTHFGDYAGLATILLLYIPLALLVTPFHRLFLLSDSHIQYPHASIERVPPLFLLLYAAIIPLLALAAWAAIMQPGAHKTRVTFHGLITSIFLTAFVTDILKNAVGRPRPDLLARCKPAVGTPRDVLVDISVCTETEPHLLQDGWRSFPSGHSSLAFAGLGYMALFLAGQGKVGRPGSGAGLLGVLVAGLPLLGAALIAVSRTEDYRHGECIASFLICFVRVRADKVCRCLRRQRWRQSRHHDRVVKL